MDSIRNTEGEYLNMTQINSTDITNTAKCNTHDSQSQNANTEPYSDFMDNMEYFSVFRFLLDCFANYAYREK